MKSYIYQFIRGTYNKHLLAALVVLFVSYSGLVAHTIISVNQRKDLRTEIRQTQSMVSDLEITFFAQASQINTTTISQLGLVDAPVPYFVYENPDVEKVALVR